MKTKEINNRLEELRKEREIYKYRRDLTSEDREKRDELDIEIKKLSVELVERKERKVRTWQIILLVVSIVLLVSGIVLLTMYNYGKGYWVFVEEHNLVEWVKGDGGLMLRKLYDKLFLLSSVGGWSSVLGVIGIFGFISWKVMRDWC